MISQFSFIIPIYNSSQFIDDCFTSIFSQKNISFEIICVDDGSTDNSIEKIKEYQKQYTNIVLVQQDNSGPGVARNTGFAHAQGEYIWFVDSDDYIAENILSLLHMNALEHNSDIMCFNSITVKNRSARIKAGSDIVCRKLTASEALIFEPSAPWARIYKRDFLIENKMQFPPYYFAEDLVETSRLFSCCTAIHKTETDAYIYYDNSKSISKAHYLSSQRKNDFSMIARILKNLSEQSSVFSYEFEYILIKHAQTYIANLKKLPGDNTELIQNIEHIISSIDIENNFYLKFERNAQRYYITSASWKITKPLRIMNTLFRYLKNLLKK